MSRSAGAAPPWRTSAATRGRAPVAGLDLAFTLHGPVTELPEAVEGTVALRLEVTEVQDHMQPTFTINRPRSPALDRRRGGGG